MRSVWRAGADDAPRPSGALPRRRRFCCMTSHGGSGEALQADRKHGSDKYSLMERNYDKRLLNWLSTTGDIDSIPAELKISSFKVPRYINLVSNYPVQLRLVSVNLYGDCVWRVVGGPRSAFIYK